MSGNRTADKAGDADDFDFDLDLDELDDAALQRLLDADPELESELKAIETAEEDLSAAPPPPADDDPFGDEPPAVEAAQPAPPAVPFDDDPLGETEPPLPPPLGEEETTASALPPVVGPEGAAEDAEAEYLDTAAGKAARDGEGDTFAQDPEQFANISLPPIPRINIHAFCCSDRMTRLTEQAACDRRMSKAHVTVQSGDARRAAAVYSAEPTPNLLIIEAGDSPTELTEGLDQLASVCDPSTKVIVVGEINDIRLYRELIDRGVSDYLVRLRSPLQLISTVANLYGDPTAPAIGRSYAFVGARGGVGSSTLCHNVAWVMAEELKSDTVLVDFDLAFGTVSLDFEHDPSQGLAEALGAPERLDEVLLDRLLQKCTDRLSLFAAPNILDRDYDLPAESYEVVMELVRKSAPSVAIDLPHVWSGWSKSVLQSADDIVLVATPDLASFRNAKNIVEVLKGQRTNDAEPIVVLNQCGVPKRPEVPAAQFADALGIEPLTSVVWDPVTFGAAATNADAVTEAAPKSKPAQAVRQIAERLLGREGMAQRGGGFSIKSLFSK